MARRRDSLFQDTFIARPLRAPEPREICINEMIPVDELVHAHELRRWGGDGPAEFARRMRERMTLQLAQFIERECVPFEIPDLLEASPYMTVGYRLTINDYGSYQNMLPQAREEGRRKGFDEGHARASREARDAIPYGMEPENQEE